jgi:hypothetical protein
MIKIIGSFANLTTTATTFTIFLNKKLKKLNRWCALREYPHFFPKPFAVAAAPAFFLLGSSSSLLEPADLIAAAFLAPGRFPEAFNRSSFSSLESFQDAKERYATPRVTTESATIANVNITVMTGSSAAGPATSVLAGTAEVKASSAQEGATLARETPVPIIPDLICHGSLLRLLLVFTGRATVVFLVDEIWHLVTIWELLMREQVDRCIMYAFRVC